MRNLVFPYLLFMIAVIGCSDSKINSKQVESLPTENLQIGSAQDFENKIVFLTIRMTQTDSVRDTYSFKLTNRIIVDGQLKRTSMATFQPEPNYLYCEILDDDKKRTDYIRVENPLFKVYEFNDKPGSPLKKKAIKNTQGELNLRFQLDKNSKYLSIYKTSPDFKTLKKVYHAAISH